MRIHKVQGILAVSANHVVGQKDMIPWHHSGDFKRFKSTTMGHGVLMGYPTFVGMAQAYTKPGHQDYHNLCNAISKILVLNRIEVDDCN